MEFIDIVLVILLSINLIFAGMGRNLSGVCGWLSAIVFYIGAYI